MDGTSGEDKLKISIEVNDEGQIIRILVLVDDPENNQFCRLCSKPGNKNGQKGYYKIIFRGKNPLDPRPGEFFQLFETSGLPVNGALPKSSGIITNISGNYLTKITLEWDASQFDIEKFIDQLAEEGGYTVRMGNHEVGWSAKRKNFVDEYARRGSIHLHLEKMDFDGEIISYTVNIDASALIQGTQTAGDILSAYKHYFKKYLDITERLDTPKRF